jgi:error-prone DNA polymerase
VGGFIISRGPLAELVPVENAAMADAPSSSGTRTTSNPRPAQGRRAGLGMLSAIRRSWPWWRSGAGSPSRWPTSPRARKFTT